MSFQGWTGSELDKKKRVCCLFLKVIFILDIFFLMQFWQQPSELEKNYKMKTVVVGQGASQNL